MPLPWWTSKSTIATRLPWAAIACAAPIPTLLRKQKPLPPATLSQPSTIAWCPGGRTRQKAACDVSLPAWANTPSIAATTAPAARRAARSEPAETCVMPSGLAPGKVVSRSAPAPTRNGESGRTGDDGRDFCISASTVSSAERYAAEWTRAAAAGATGAKSDVNVAPRSRTRSSRHADSRSAASWCSPVL